MALITLQEALEQFGDIRLTDAFIDEEVVTFFGSGFGFHMHFMIRRSLLDSLTDDKKDKQHVTVMDMWEIVRPLSPKRYRLIALDSNFQTIFST